jgi:hypothetical protein
MRTAAQSGSGRGILKRIGLGDVLVLLSLGLLAYLTWEPHAKGSAESGREEAAGEQLLSLGRELQALELHDEIERAAALARRIEDLVFRLEFQPRRPDSQQFWTDASHELRLRAPSQGHGEAALLVTPKLEGTEPYVLPRDLERIPEESGPPALQHAAQLLRILREETRVWELLARMDRRVAQVNLESEAGGYRFTYGFVPRSDGKQQQIQIELFGYPQTFAEDGFAVFRWTPSRGLQQTRNLVFRYSLEHPPAPLAGLFRPGTNYDGGLGYTGLDGNQWLPVFPREDLSHYSEFERLAKLLEQHSFTKQLAQLRTRWEAWEEASKTPLRLDFAAYLDPGIPLWSRRDRGEKPGEGQEKLSPLFVQPQAGVADELASFLGSELAPQREAFAALLADSRALLPQALDLARGLGFDDASTIQSFGTRCRRLAIAPSLLRKDGHADCRGRSL